MISNHVSARQNLTGHLGCSVDQIDTLGGETMGKAGGSWAWSLGSEMPKKEPPATMKILGFL